MAEWLTHVCVAYAGGILAGWRLDWLDRRWVTVAMIGSILPDLNRLGLLVSDEQITAVIGLPFSWKGVHTLGSVLLLAGLGALVFDTPSRRRRAFGLLCCGGLSNIVLDLPQRYADGLALTNIYLFPLPPWRVPTPGWYVSADRWIVVLALGLAGIVSLADRIRAGRTDTRRDRPTAGSTGDSGRLDD
jgi:hypothetical protein